MYFKPPAEDRGTTHQGRAQGAPPHEGGIARRPSGPEERYHDEGFRLPADKDAKLAFLRGVIDEGAGRGWKLIGATKDPAAEVLLVTWDTQWSLVD